MKIENFIDSCIVWICEFIQNILEKVLEKLLLHKMTNAILNN